MRMSPLVFDWRSTVWSVKPRLVATTSQIGDLADRDRGRVAGLAQRDVALLMDERDRQLQGAAVRDLELDLAELLLAERRVWT